MRDGAALVGGRQPVHGALESRHDLGDLDLALREARQKAEDHARQDQLKVLGKMRIDLGQNRFGDDYDDVDVPPATTRFEREATAFGAIASKELTERERRYWSLVEAAATASG